MNYNVQYAKKYFEKIVGDDITKKKIEIASALIDRGLQIKNGIDFVFETDCIIFQVNLLYDHVGIKSLLVNKEMEYTIDEVSYFEDSNLIIEGIDRIFRKSLSHM